MPADPAGSIQQSDEDDEHLQYLKSRRPPQRSRRVRPVVGQEEAIATRAWINGQLLKAGVDLREIEKVLARRK